MTYRWHNHGLPSQLSDCASSELAFDPLSGPLFVCGHTAGGGYELYSKGRPGTGSVDLSYQGRPAKPQVTRP